MSTKKDDAATAQTNAADQATGTTPVVADKPHYAVRDFNDAGTERAFARGDKLTDVEPGSLVNYVAAGLASTDNPKAEQQPA